ncbi:MULTISPECIES: hypothetical protein [unclassified Caballeronia]|uniref:hypothetical protein n=1 Tax=unclassified Caballeronia TaxID=2646786 RepID=UPI0020294ABF|nr:MULTISPECIES: hypothetical protein [unclassified Caballeronia]
MFKKLITAAVVVASATAAGSVFASSGYGLAPHGDTSAGVRASQRAQRVQSINDSGMQGYGGMRDVQTQSGSASTITTFPTSGTGSLFAHH